MNLFKTLEELRSLASSEGQYLENHLGSTQSSLRNQLEQLMERENEMRFKESQFESGLIDLEEKKLEVESLQSLIDKKCEELEVKQNLHNAIQISIKAKEAEFDLVQNSISEAAQKLDLLKKSAEQKSEEAESKSEELDSIRGTLKKFEDAMPLKGRQINFELAEHETEMLSKEKELEAKEFQLNVELGELDSLIETKCEELEVKEKQYALIQMSIKEKGVELGLIQKSIPESSEKLDSLEKRVKQKYEEAEVKTKEVGLLEGILKKFDDVTQLKDDRSREMKKSYEDYRKKLDLTKENLVHCRISIDDCDKEIKLKQEKLKFVSNELELKEKRLHLVHELNEKYFNSLRKSMDQRANELDVKVRKFEDFMNQCATDLDAKQSKFQNFVKELELKGDLLESQIEELDFIRMKVNECLKEVDSKEKNFVLVQKSLEVHSNELKIKEGQYEGRLKEFELRQAEFESMIRESVGVKEEKLVLSEQRNTSPASDIRNPLDGVGRNGEAQLCQAICGVRKAPDVGESIQNLILRGETIHAVAHICELKLTDKFSPIPLLTEYLEDAENFTALFCRWNKSNEVKEKAKKKEVAALRTVTECMKICNLNSELLSNKISKRIGVLEKKGHLFGSEVEHLNKRTLFPWDQPPPQQGNFKSPRMTKMDDLWTKHPIGYVKMNFGFANRANCGFLSIVACDHNAALLAIWCRKIMNSDPLEGEALAAHGALSLAASSGWDYI